MQSPRPSAAVLPTLCWRQLLKGKLMKEPGRPAINLSLADLMVVLEVLDRPARTLIRDEIMVDIIKRDPKSTADLQGMRGLGVARRD